MRCADALTAEPCRHGPVLGTAGSPNQGRYLWDEGVGGTFGDLDKDSLRTIEFRSGDQVDVLGAVAAAGTGTEIWWAAPDSFHGKEIRIGELPWTQCHTWDGHLEDWAAGVTSEVG